jgi:hypothetical protein
MPGAIIIDLLSSDPTFQKRSSKFQAFKEANKMLLKSKEFARDVGMFSILQGSEYSGLREVLGVDKVRLLWKGSTWPRCKPHSFVAGTRKMLTRTRKSFLFS